MTQKSSFDTADPITARYYLLTTSLENYIRTQERQFSEQGLKSKHGQKAEAIKAGDYFLYYLTGLKVFAGSVCIMSSVYRESTRIWRSTTDETDMYEHRFRIEPDIVLKNEPFVPIVPVVPDLEFLKKWPPRNYYLGFQGQIREIPKRDFRTIRNQLLEKMQVAV